MSSHRRTVLSSQEFVGGKELLLDLADRVQRSGCLFFWFGVGFRRDLWTCYLIFILVRNGKVQWPGGSVVFWPKARLWEAESQGGPIQQYCL